MTHYNYDPTAGGIKLDQDKPRWHLLPLELLEGVIRVLMHGEKKYTSFNWAKGMPYTRVIDAAQRHLVAIQRGEDKDPDSGLDHVDHLMCELLFLKYYMLHGVGEDDRFKSQAKQEQTEKKKAFIEAMVKEHMNFRYRPLTNADLPVMQTMQLVLPELQQRSQLLSDMSHEDEEGDPNYWGV